MLAKIKKVSNNPNPVVDHLLMLNGENEVKLHNLPEVGHSVLFDTQHDTIFTTSVKTLEWAMDKKSVTFWTKNTEYKLDFKEPVNVE